MNILNCKIYLVVNICDDEISVRKMFIKMFKNGCVLLS